jgi:hypothetical protein
MLHVDQETLSSLEQGLPDHKTAVLRALQTALQIEHATVPIYLFALYSLKPSLAGGPGPNEEIASILRSVVHEEMLHMTIVCNVLNALGGYPAIDRADFIPHYPGTMPGTVADGTILRLAPFSRELVREVFMPIEEPRTVLRFGETSKPRATDDPSRDASRGDTIGEFYVRIVRHIRDLGDEAFDGDPARQVDRLVPSSLRDLVVVKDVETASRALEVIISQGEGSTGSPLDLDHAYAHYYRFLELAEMRRLVVDSNAPEGFALGPRICSARDLLSSGEPRRARTARAPCAERLQLHVHDAPQSVARSLQRSPRSVPRVLRDHDVVAAAGRRYDGRNEPTKPDRAHVQVPGCQSGVSVERSGAPRVRRDAQVPTRRSTAEIERCASHRVRRILKSPARAAPNRASSPPPAHRPSRAR